MKYRMFTYGVTDDGELTELNAFLSAHRVLDVRHHAAEDGRRVVFVVEYLDANRKQPEQAPRIDYREELTDGQFAIFSQLRDLRKQVAEETGVPVYNIFTNSQLAEMVTSEIRQKSQLKHIAGIGESRIEKYGERFVAQLKDLMGASE